MVIVLVTFFGLFGQKNEYCIKMKFTSQFCSDLHTDVSACQMGLTMCYPAMFAVFTLSPSQLPRLEAVTATIHQSAADSLFIQKKRDIQKSSRPSSEFLKPNSDFELGAVTIYVFLNLEASGY